MGVGGAKDVIYGYPAGGPISLPPDVVLKFPPTTEVVCKQRMVQLRKNFTAIEVADM